MIATQESLGGRIGVLKERIAHGRSHSERISEQRKAIFGRVLGVAAGRPRAEQMAAALAAFLREKDVVLYAEDFFAGHEQYYDFSLPPAPRVDRSGPDAATIAAFGRGQHVGLYGCGMGGHVIAGYPRVLENGFGGLARQAAAQAQEAQGRAGEVARACLIALEAARDYALRYAAAAESMAQEASETACRERMRRIAGACEWIATNPPRSFFEAVQLLWLTHEILTCEQRSGSMSLGRIDQYLHPYYAADLAAGNITRDEAGELIQALWLKFNGVGAGFQNVTLGGVGPDGTYAANEITFLCIEATRAIRLSQPLLSVRWHPSMPAALWERIVDLLSLGLGFPALFNDEVAIEAKCHAGIPREDACNYGIVGCVELSIPGREFSHTEGLRVNWAKALELMLNGGLCVLTGEQAGPPPAPLETLTTFEQFCGAYKRQLEQVTHLGAAGLNIIDREFPGRTPYPFLSATMDGCLDRGRDVSDGGTEYNLSSVNGLGMADTADSLVAVKKLVYEQGEFSLVELAELLRTDFEGCEHLPSRILRTVPRCGNDLDEPDGLLRELADTFVAAVESHTNPRGGRFQTGLYTVSAHAGLGERTGALPSGRRAGKALANGMSPCQGAEVAGPTATIRTITRLDHRRLGNGMVLDIKFRPSFFGELVRRGALHGLIETYFQLGGLEIQFNVVDRQTLVDAQTDPDAHGNLLVRVSGYSDYFVRLTRTCQDEIIARTEHDRE